MDKICANPSGMSDGPNSQPYTFQELIKTVKAEFLKAKYILNLK